MMTAFLWMMAVTAGSALAAILVLERLLHCAVHWCANLLPDEFCGPDGWLVDTSRRCGVFDRAARR